MPNHAGRCALFVILVAGMTTSALADGGWNNDAGTGADAGNVRSEATRVGYAIKYGGAFTPNDVDWYEAIAQEQASPTCVKATVHTATRAFFALAAETATGTTAAPILVAPGEEGIAGVAGITPLTSTLRVRRDPTASSNLGSYDFRLDRVGVPADGGDAGSAYDAGDGSSTALVALPGCTPGKLAATDLDVADTYSIFVPDGSVVTYSLASDSADVALTLLNSLGESIGPTVERGEVATAAPTPGVYYMSAQRTGAGDASYVIGAVTGPEPTGCRPYCLD